MTYSNINGVIRYLWSFTDKNPGIKVYCILDGARNEKIYPALTEAVSEREYRCLYLGHKLLFLGKMPRVLAKAAPYLVKLRPNSNFTRWMISRGWGESWGIFFISSVNLDSLMNHFRRFLMVKEESGKKLYFRYYDPRVLRIYLPTCNTLELEMIFGPVQRFYVEGEGSDSLIEYFRSNDMLEQKTVVLTK